jgi:hypothetical protein
MPITGNLGYLDNEIYKTDQLIPFPLSFFTALSLMRLVSLLLVVGVYTLPLPFLFPVDK